MASSTSRWDIGASVVTTGAVVATGSGSIREDEDRLTSSTLSLISCRYQPNVTSATAPRNEDDPQVWARESPLRGT